MKQFLSTALTFGLAFHAPLMAEEPVVAPDPSEEVIPALEETTGEAEVTTTEGGSDVEIVVDEIKVDVVNDGGDDTVVVVVDDESPVVDGIDFELMEEGIPGSSILRLAQRCSVAPRGARAMFRLRPT